MLYIVIILCCTRTWLIIRTTISINSVIALYTKYYLNLFSTIKKLVETRGVYGLYTPKMMLIYNICSINIKKLKDCTH